MATQTLLAAPSFLVIIMCLGRLADTRISDEQKTPRSTVSSHTDPASLRLLDRYGDIRLTVAWNETSAPHREEQMMMLHCSMHRARGLPSFGREMEACHQLSFTFGRCGQRSSDPSYVSLGRADSQPTGLRREWWA